MQKRNKVLAGVLTGALVLSAGPMALAATANYNDSSVTGGSAAWQDWVKEWETVAADYTKVSLTPGADETQLNFAWYSKTESGKAATPVAGEARVSVLDRSLPQPQLRFRTAKAEYERWVEETKRHIVDGDVFQTVISQRLDLDSPADPFDVYRVLRTLNPSPYMYFMTLTDAEGRDFNVIGSSPETLIKVDNGHAMTFPIAGSRPRGATPEEDERLAKELLADPKERSEHIMLVDLSRNDLSKVCLPSSVEVVQLMDIKRFSHIMHICSTVTGTVDPNLTTFDVFMSAFPAGTLSGAPKPRAIEIIDELEAADRGIYGGTVGYFDFSGNMDMAIAIRTAFLRDHEASVQAGAGIVLDSVPATEWQETRSKAEASVEAIQIAAQLRSVE